MKEITILISTYNGGAFLPHQLDSLLQQTYQEFCVFIRDDGSSDNTRKVIEQYVHNHPDKFHHIDDNLGNIGSSNSFMYLLSVSNSEYIMFCDQDDFWLPNKIKLSIAETKKIEEKHPKEPVMVFTDLQVVNSKMEKIHDSFWEYQKINPDISKNWKQNLAQSVVTGCTMIINKYARDIALPFKIPNMLHDHWISTIVSRQGNVSYLPKQTILYRQHGKNVLGAQSISFLYLIKKMKRIKKTYHIYCKAIKVFGHVSWVQLLFLKVLITTKRILS